MKIIKPSFYDSFVCTADQCGDNCCRAGWEIAIDSETVNFYKKSEAPLAKAFLKQIRKRKGEYSLKLNKSGSCEFLTAEGLCRLCCEFGGEHISDICRLHPRFFEWFGDITEQGLGLCCEEAARLLFADSEPLSLVALQNSDPYDADVPEYDKALCQKLFAARQAAFLLLQNRTFGIAERAALLLDLGSHLHIAAANNDIAAIGLAAEEYSDIGYAQTRLEKLTSAKAEKSKPDLLLGIAESYAMLEYLTAKGRQSIDYITANAPAITAAADAFDKLIADRAYEYEKLIAYIIYRFFMKAVFDEDILSKIKFAVTSYIIINAMDISVYIKSGRFTFKDRIDNVKLYSKEIEYSTDNLFALAEECYENEFFNFDNLLAYLL